MILSSAYSKSITQQTFEKGLPAGRQGFGLAFNNTTQKIDPVFLRKDDQVHFDVRLSRSKQTIEIEPIKLPN